MSLSNGISIDRQVLGYCLNIDFFSKVKNKIDREMFDAELRDIFDTVVYSHTKYERNISVSELQGIFNDRNPAMPQSTRSRIQEIIGGLITSDLTDDMHTDLIIN